nr:hypothetical protein [Propioniciclava coleopterorum]
MQFPQRLVRPLLDAVECGVDPGADRVGAPAGRRGQRAGAAGLQDDPGQRVRHDVVQVAGDSAPLRDPRGVPRLGEARLQVADARRGPGGGPADRPDGRRDAPPQRQDRNEPIGGDRPRPRGRVPGVEAQRHRRGREREQRGPPRSRAGEEEEPQQQSREGLPRGDQQRDGRRQRGRGAEAEGRTHGCGRPRHDSRERRRDEGGDRGAAAGTQSRGPVPQRTLQREAARRAEDHGGERGPP